MPGDTLALFHYDTVGTSAPVNETGNGNHGEGSQITVSMAEAGARFGVAGIYSEYERSTADVEYTTYKNVPSVSNVNAIGVGTNGYTIEYFVRASKECQWLYNSSYLVEIVDTTLSDFVRIGAKLGSYAAMWVDIRYNGEETWYPLTNISELENIITPANTWVHVAVVLTPEWDIIIYINGQKYAAYTKDDLNAVGIAITQSIPLSNAMEFFAQPTVHLTESSTSVAVSFDEFRVSAGRIYTGDSFTPPTAPLEVESTTQTLSTTVEAAEPIALTADIAGSFEVKFAGNFVSNAATTGGGTAKAIAYPLLLKMDPYDKPMHLEIQYSKDAGYATTTPLINTKTTASDRVYVMGDGGTSFEQCPETGFPPEVFSNAPIMVNMAKLGTLDGFYYIRYRWLSTTDTAVSDWYRTVYPAYTDIGF